MKPVIIFVRFQQKLEYDDKHLVGISKLKFLEICLAVVEFFLVNRQTDGRTDRSSFSL